MLRAQVAGLLVRDGRVLLCLRSATRSYYPEVWDFPGGHVEAGETGSAALRRELAEELGVAVPHVPDLPWARIVDEDLGFDLGLWVVREWSDSPENCAPMEHDAIGWFAHEEAKGLALALAGYGALIARAVSRVPERPRARPRRPRQIARWPRTA